jgi:hypothetical protein
MIELFKKGLPKSSYPYRIILHDEETEEWRGIYEQIDAMDNGWA